MVAQAALGFDRPFFKCTGQLHLFFFDKKISVGNQMSKNSLLMMFFVGPCQVVNERSCRGLMYADLYPVTSTYKQSETKATYKHPETPQSLCLDGQELLYSRCT